MYDASNSKRSEGLAYMASQALAAIIATASVGALFPWTSTSSPYQTLTIDIASDASLMSAFMMETFLTFVLVYVIFATAFDTVDSTNQVKVLGSDKTARGNLTIYTANGNTKAGFAPLSIGLTLGFLAFVGGTVSGSVANPLRVFGPGK